MIVLYRTDQQRPGRKLYFVAFRSVCASPRHAHKFAPGDDIDAFLKAQDSAHHTWHREEYNLPAPPRFLHYRRGISGSRYSYWMMVQNTSVCLLQCVQGIQPGAPAALWYHTLTDTNLLRFEIDNAKAIKRKDFNNAKKEMLQALDANIRSLKPPRKPKEKHVL